jgi:NAD(P)-dependent dehydrogenase (short-subunit alcohol dehydrogenase family)
MSDHHGLASERRVAGKVAVVTGAASGIGRALACGLAARGANVVLADRDELKLGDAVAEAASYGTAVTGATVDVTSREDLDRLRDSTLARHGAVDILCNNAGVMGPVGNPLWELPTDEWRRVLEINLIGVINALGAFLPCMIDTTTPRYVLNTASMAGLTSSLSIPEYTVSKHGVVALSESLRLQLEARRSPVRVTVLCPGAVATDLASRENRRLGSVAGTAQWAAAPDGSSAAQAFVPAEEVARGALDGMLEGRFIVLTHPGSRERVHARFRALLEGD